MAVGFKSEWMPKLTAHAVRSERTMRSLSPTAMLIALVLSGATFAKVAAQLTPAAAPRVDQLIEWLDAPESQWVAT